MTYSRSKIIDEFTNLPVSRERKKQLRYEKNNRCIRCGAVAVTKELCLKHLIISREAQRKSHGNKRRNNSMSYKLERTIK